MSTYTQILYQVVFSTYQRKKVIHPSGKTELLKFIWGLLKQKKCHLYRINAVDDHIHMLFSLHPTIALADLVKDIKLAASRMIKEKRLFRGFEGWQNGYAAFTYSIDAKDNLIEYIKNQEIHHKKESSYEEYKRLLDEFLVKYEEKYLN